ncbi:MAG: hypothetical protein KGY60_12760, partial [Bacteroidales bacterium]|nr:hypothetical protein [Bacteroidales bacterium]
MSKSFDKILVRRIREVFDNHQEPVDPGAWKDMERRLNRRNNMRVVYMRRVAGVAALLLVLMLIFRPFESRRDAAPSMERVVESEPATSAESQGSQGPAVADGSGEQTGNEGSGSEKMAATKEAGAEGGRDEPVRSPDALVREGEGDAGKVLIAEKQQDQPEDGEEMESLPDIRKRAVLVSGISPPADTHPAPGELNETEAAKARLAQTDQTGNVSVWENLPAPAESREDKKPFDLEVEFSTLYNYSSSMIASEVNFAGGVISEFQVLPDLTLSTGLVVSRQYFTTRKQSRGLTSYLSANSSYSRT